MGKTYGTQSLLDKSGLWNFSNEYHYDDYEFAVYYCIEYRS